MPESQVRIRSWKTEDLGTIRTITWTTWVDAYGSFIPEADLRAYFDRTYAVDELAGLLVSPLFRGLLAEVDGQPSGYAKVACAPEEARCYLSSLYVLPTYQGKGIGSLLLKEAERHALEFGMTAIWLGVMVQNTPTLRWYERIGFTFVEEQPFTMGATSVPHRIGYRPIRVTPESHRNPL
jgi:ribosomal protein S18 acetylase RimI-like enzyme